MFLVFAAIIIAAAAFAAAAFVSAAFAVVVGISVVVGSDSFVSVSIGSGIQYSVLLLFF